VLQWKKNISIRCCRGCFLTVVLLCRVYTVVYSGHMVYNIGRRILDCWSQKMWCCYKCCGKKEISERCTRCCFLAVVLKCRCCGRKEIFEDRRMLVPKFGAVVLCCGRCTRCWFLNCGADTLKGSVPIPKCSIIVKVQMLWKEGDL